jgi:hypothetical protein
MKFATACPYSDPEATARRMRGHIMMFKSVLILAALLWAASAEAGDDELIQIAKTAVVAKLIHPDSARFMDVRAIDKNGHKIVCGHVEAMDRKGENDAAKPFVFIAGEKNAQHSAIIYGGRSITNDRFSNFAEPAAFTDLCGP